MTDTFQRFKRIHQRVGDEIGELIKLQARVATAYTAAMLTLPDGTGSGAGGEPVSGGAVSNPTLGVIIARENTLDTRYDPRTDEYRRAGASACETSLDVIHAAITECFTELDRIVAPTLTADGTIGPQPGSGHCRACRRWVTGIGTDRLKTGFCHRDYQRWLRAERPDIIAFIRQVQLERGLIRDDQKPIIPDLTDS